MAVSFYKFTEVVITRLVLLLDGHESPFKEWTFHMRTGKLANSTVASRINSP